MVQAQPQRECRRNAASIGDFGRSNNWANTVQREHPSLRSRQINTPERNS